MAEPFLGEIRLFSFNFPPKGWAFCNGQLLAINQNQALFALLGTGFGGNGQTNFALPDLRNRVPIHAGAGFDLYQKAGEEAHTITNAEMPQHIHFVQAGAAVATTNAGSTGHLLSRSKGSQLYTAPRNLTPMSSGIMTTFGGSQPHNNMQPYQNLNFCIALQGIFPSFS